MFTVNEDLRLTSLFTIVSKEGSVGIVDTDLSECDWVCYLMADKTYSEEVSSDIFNSFNDLMQRSEAYREGVKGFHTCITEDKVITPDGLGVIKSHTFLQCNRYRAVLLDSNFNEDTLSSMINECPKEGDYYVTEEVAAHVRGKIGYRAPRVSWLVNPFMGTGTKIPTELSLKQLNNLLIALNNPSELTVHVVGDIEQVQKKLGKGLEYIRSLLLSTLGIVPSVNSVEATFSLPYFFCSWPTGFGIEELCDYDSRLENGYPTLVMQTHKNAVKGMLGLMWGLIYFDTEYFGVDPYDTSTYNTTIQRVVNEISRYANKKVVLPFRYPMVVALLSCFVIKQDRRCGIQRSKDQRPQTLLDIADSKSPRDIYDFLLASDVPTMKVFRDLGKLSRAFFISLYKKVNVTTVTFAPTSVFKKRSKLARELFNTYKCFSSACSMGTMLNVADTLTEFYAMFGLTQLHYRNDNISAGLHMLSMCNGVSIHAILSDISDELVINAEGLFTPTLEEGVTPEPVYEHLLAYRTNDSSVHFLLRTLEEPTDWAKKIKVVDSNVALELSFYDIANKFLSSILEALERGYNTDKYNLIDKSDLNSLKQSPEITIRDGKSMEELILTTKLSRIMIFMESDLRISYKQVIALYRLTGNEALKGIIEVLANICRKYFLDYSGYLNTHDHKYSAHRVALGRDYLRIYKYLMGIIKD